jgi:predicted nuclease with TOPRIM domain
MMVKGEKKALDPRMLSIKDQQDKAIVTLHKTIIDAVNEMKDSNMQVMKDNFDLGTRVKSLADAVDKVGVAVYDLTRMFMSLTEKCDRLEARLKGMEELVERTEKSLIMADDGLDTRIRRLEEKRHE